MADIQMTDIQEIAEVLQALDKDNPAHLRAAAKYGADNLIAVARKAENISAREMAIAALALFPQDNVIIALRQIAWNDKRLCYEAVETLSRMNNPKATQALLTLLKSPLAVTRRLAIGELASKRPTRQDALQAARNESAPEVIEAFLDHDCLPGNDVLTVMDFLSHPHDRVRHATLFWLQIAILKGRLPKDVIPVVRERLSKAMRAEKARSLIQEMRETLQMLPGSHTTP